MAIWEGIWGYDLDYGLSTTPAPRFIEPAKNQKDTTQREQLIAKGVIKPFNYSEDLGKYREKQKANVIKILQEGGDTSYKSSLNDNDKLLVDLMHEFKLPIMDIDDIRSGSVSKMSYITLARDKIYEILGEEADALMPRFLC